MAEEVITEKTVKKTKEYISALGRRREAIARVRIYVKVPDNLVFGSYSVKKGDIVVNGRHVTKYFSGPVSQAVYEAPFKATNTLNKFAITAKVAGGGMQSQLDSLVLGVARALSLFDKENKALLRKKGLLTRDARVRERRKVGMGGKARRRKQSPKR